MKPFETILALLYIKQTRRENKHMNGRDLEELIVANKPVVCEKCNGKMFYVHGGLYRCEKCGHEILDDFGKVKQFLESNGPTSVFAISQATGVDMEIIEIFLRQGRVEIPEGSKYYISCEKCGCSIRYGRFCPECVRELAGGIKSAFLADMGERPKHDNSMHGKVHFLNRVR